MRRIGIDFYEMLVNCWLLILRVNKWHFHFHFHLLFLKLDRYKKTKPEWEDIYKEQNLCAVDSSTLASRSVQQPLIYNMYISMCTTASNLQYVH